MSKTKKEDHKEERPKKPSRNKIMLAIIILLVLAIAGAGAYAAMFFLKKNGKIKYEQRIYNNLALPEEIIKFSFEKIPDVYKSLAVLNDEIDKIDNEIKRLAEIEEKYPKQKKIPSSERKNLEKLKKTTASSIAKIEKEIETSFVMSLVEPAKGEQYLREKQPELEKAASEAVVQIIGQPETPEQKKEEAKGILSRITGIFKKK